MFISILARGLGGISGDNLTLTPGNGMGKRIENEPPITDHRLIKEIG
jgi:hypothetical protein